ncbi:hypothetical protein QJS10_CPA01g00990 [Acorus calamus]|uniref:Late embryogenesis abundant protein LEA-2 subgroup domain-containing protein n=1 Tax=Acorus calamus TaxID=4465 RepID=A0AAV9FLV4_ACOCL|nr:hypothetical protein QJS10_CPA01g00990 [Acorus calamus]
MDPCNPKSFQCWLLQFLTLLGLLILCLWLTLLPKSPTYTIVYLYAPPFTVAPPQNNTTNNNDIQFRVEIDNPNDKSGIQYGDTNLTIYYYDGYVGSATLPSFYQGNGKTYVWVGVVSVVGGGNSRFRAARNGSAELRVMVAAAMRHRVMGVKGRWKRVELGGFVGVGLDGRMSGKNRKVKLKSVKNNYRAHYGIDLIG